MILDLLLEKKDLLIYVDIRIEVLEHLRKNIKQFKEKDRSKISNRITGRIKELKNLKVIIHDNRIKLMAKRFWLEAERLK